MKEVKGENLGSLGNFDIAYPLLLSELRPFRITSCSGGGACHFRTKTGIPVKLGILSCNSF